jgi:hypothetical protein
MNIRLSAAALRLYDVIADYNNIELSSSDRAIFGVGKVDVKNAADELRVILAEPSSEEVNALFKSTALRLCGLVDEHVQLDETSATQMLLGVCKGDLENAACDLRAITRAQRLA